MSKSELCGHAIRAYLFYARELQRQNTPYGWVLDQIKDINKLRQHYKYIETEPTATFELKAVA